MIHIIAAHDIKRGIGRKGSLPWHISKDLRRFKELTIDHPVIMGRKTWESLPKSAKPLPNRVNILITRDPEYHAPGATLSPSIGDALKKAEKARGGEEIFIIGGGEIYTLALPYTDLLHLTVVETDADADTFFPEYENEFSEVIEDSHHNDGELRFSFVTRKRKSKE